MKENTRQKNIGLSGQRVLVRRQRFGWNELPAAVSHRGWKILLNVLREPMFILLLLAVAIYLLLGSWWESLILLVFVTVVIWITYYQERKTERALAALRALSAPRAKVIRDGQEKEIAARELVPGDLVIINEGDSVPADAELISADNLTVDESLLTGESLPVHKSVNSFDDKSDGTRLNMVYSGTLVVAGQAHILVQKIGSATEIGHIGQSVRTIKSEVAPVQKETKKLVIGFASAGIGFCVLFVFVYWLTRGDFLGALLGGIAMSMSVLPEEFPVVMTVFLALGAWCLSKKNVLTRSIPAIESLGETTVLAVDKTGTVTQNKMAVARLYADGYYYDRRVAADGLPERFHRLAEYAVLAGQPRPYDPMEKAIREFGQQYLIEPNHWHDGEILIKQYPLSAEMLSVSHVWQSPDRKGYLIAAKGAPEAIIDLCHLTADEKGNIMSAVESMADQGLRVLGVAAAEAGDQKLPEQQHAFPFKFLGLVGLADPVRPRVKEAVQECYQAGIRVIMITGDYAKTAANIAAQIGLRNPQLVVTGADLSEMSIEKLRRRISEISVFARVRPQQKLKIVQALKENGEIVAMTGDGVNDAPALKAAHIGVAMGQRGTDVARESASIVLLDDNFTSIVGGIRRGRKIFDNLKKAMAYIFSVHIPIIAVSLLPVFFNWPLILFPVHIAFLELVIDPACSLIFEAEKEETNVMRRPPRHQSQPLFSRRVGWISFAQGLIVSLFVIAVFVTAHLMSLPEDKIRALTFVTMVVGNIGLIMINRSWSRTALVELKIPNRFLWWIISGAALCLGLVVYVPFLQDFFGFDPLSWLEVLICLGAGLISIVWFEIFKIFSRRQLA